jgi:hypothetical protein
MSLLKTIKERWKAQEPAFFLGIQKIAISVGSPAMAVWLANQSFSLNLPTVILSVCKYAITACAAMGLTAKLTCEKPPTP